MILNLLLAGTLMASQMEDQVEVYIEVNLHELSPRGQQALKQFCDNNVLDYRCNRIDDNLTVVKSYHIDHENDQYAECHTVAQFLRASEIEELVQRKYRETNEAGTVHIIFKGE